MAWLIGAGVGVTVLLPAMLALVRRFLVIITVEGVSMLPALEPGERVLVYLSRRRARRGRIVLVQQPAPGRGWEGLPPPPRRDLGRTRWYVKRVAAHPGDPIPEQMAVDGAVPAGHVVLLGDHPHSIDSRQHGLCPVDQIIGVVIRRLPSRQRPRAPQPS
jgi:hypothetical protein